MSSIEFSVLLEPAQKLRRLVLAAGAACGLSGAALVLLLPFPPLLLAVLVATWLAMSLFELRIYHRAARQVRRLRLDRNGSVTLTDAGGHAATTRLAAGSVVTRSVAWLRFRLPGGRMFGELLTADTVQPQAWHRLQLIWQQGRTFIGSHGGS